LVARQQDPITQFILYRSDIIKIWYPHFTFLARRCLSW
jgi:hypothetical protein